ncbi:MAG: hydrogenase small subunit [Coriobacteriia bacterium]|nr:hydrogenase small subunit [Coriobacteriia bacterium]
MPGKNGVLPQELKARGITRRDFTKFCASIAAILGLEASAIPEVAAAVTKASSLKPVVWLEAGSCSGCTESTAQADYPDVATIVLDILSVNYSETLMAAAGYTAAQAKEDTIHAGGYILIYEGSVMTAWDGAALMIGGPDGEQVKGTEELKVAAKGAEAIIAVGSCAVDGGWVAADPNPAGAMGVQKFLEQEGIKKPLINLPMCPVNPEHLVAVVIDYLLLGKVPALDEHLRPKLMFGQTIHDNCPRRGHFENGEFVYQFGSEEEAKGYCLYPMGCKGPQTKTNCPIVRWNKRVSWCVEAGAPCIGCGNLNWVDADGPFFKRMRNLEVLGGVQPTTIGLGVTGVVAAGLVVHGLGMKAAGRAGAANAGGPTEAVKEYDRKRAGKGGDQ